MKINNQMLNAFILLVSLANSAIALADYASQCEIDMAKCPNGYSLAYNDYINCKNSCEAWKGFKIINGVDSYQNCINGCKNEISQGDTCFKSDQNCQNMN